MHIRSVHIRIPSAFRIWYSSTYTVLFFVLLLFLAVTPAETIFQSIRTRELQKLFVIGGVYFLTFLIVLLVYSTRLYTNRSVLQAIPKPYIPIEDGEIGKLVRRMVVKALRRSAIIAWDSRPRDVRGELGGHNEDEDGRTNSGERKHPHKRKSHGCPATVISVSARSPPWGHVSHPGWGSPTLADLPGNLQYWKVVTELPNLIEAKAVSLAPPDPAVVDQLHVQNTPMLPDAQIVALLQRPRSIGIRAYLGQLASYGLINPPELAGEFLAQYEYARFSTNSLTETEFRDLMAIFAEVLNSMTELDPALIEEVRASGEESVTRSISSSQSTSSSSTTSALPFRTPRMQSRSDYFDTGYIPSRGNESPQTVRTAPSMMRNLSSSNYTMPRTPSERSLGSGSVHVRPQQRSPSTILPNSSSSSIRSSPSIVQLRDSPRQGELPYKYSPNNG
jgi:hypothetical protein